MRDRCCTGALLTAFALGARAAAGARRRARRAQDRRTQEQGQAQRRTSRQQADKADADFAAAIDADTLATTDTEADKARGGPAPDALVALVKPRTRKIAVAEFTGKDGEHLRKTVLDVLSAQADLELLSFRDIEIVAHRIGIGQSSSDDRTRLATELGIYAWIDGDADKASVRLSDAHDETLDTLALDAAHADAQPRERLWNEVGRFISDEGLREYRVTHAREAAKQLLAAQDKEIVRQQEIAARHEQERAKRLAALKGKAQALLQQQDAELKRQVTVAAEHRRNGRTSAQGRARAASRDGRSQAQMAQQAELARQAEAARQAQLAQQAQYAQPAPGAYPAAGYQYPQAAPAATAFGGYGGASAYGAPPQPSGNFGPPAQTAAPAPAPPPGAAGPEVEGISPETRQWLLEHRARTQGGAQQ